ncbi:MAG: NF038122 family metalloprotease [Blastocatellia bacterium]
MLRQAPSRAVALACLFILNAVLLSPVGKASESIAVAAPQKIASRIGWMGADTSGTFIYRMVGGRATCLEASPEQTRRLKERDTNLPLTALTPVTDQATGLKIILRGTPQLQSYSAARDAFTRAAAQWAARIQTNIAIVIDVDFGPTLFGQPFDADAVACADTQSLAGNALFPAARDGLIAESVAVEQRSLYNSLPTRALPTDLGTSQGLAATTATLRAIGLIDAVADPEGELDDFGLPPTIAINSRFNFDFDASDGIDADKLDFEALALHEIGHILGFISSVGEREMNDSAAAQPTICDLFRLRPEAINSDFATAARVLSSGGEQRFYAGDAALALSTGRPDGTGGDGQSPAHWKDNYITGQYLGVMNPTIIGGQYHSLNDNDLAALAAIGYRTRSALDQTTVIALTSGQPQAGGLFAPPPNLAVLSHTQYAIVVPPGATRLILEMRGDQDVDLYARFGQPVVLQGHNPVVDYKSTSDSGNEAITITPTSSLPLRAGIYYMAIANWGPGDASFTVTATVTGGASVGMDNHAPVIFNLAARLEGDALQLDCAALDRDGDMATAEIGLVDEAGRLLRPVSVLTINAGNARRLESQLALNGLSALATASRADIVLVDRAGNRSAEAGVDFSRADSGGLSLTAASFTGAQLTLKARGLTEGLAVEINGRVVAPPQKIKIKGAGSKLIISGDANQLALRSGANRIRVRNINGWSNSFVLSM